MSSRHCMERILQMLSSQRWFAGHASLAMWDETQSLPAFSPRPPYPVCLTGHASLSMWDETQLFLAFSSLPPHRVCLPDVVWVSCFPGGVPWPHGTLALSIVHFSIDRSSIFVLVVLKINLYMSCIVLSRTQPHSMVCAAAVIPILIYK